MERKENDRLFWIWLSRRVGPGSTLYPALLERFGTPYDIYTAEEETIAETLPELGQRERKSLCNKDLSEAYEILAYCRRNGYSLLCYDDARYPLSLRSLSDPPLLLYYRGVLPDFQSRLCIAMVGTRRMSEYGRRIAYKIAYELANAGVIVVSGMALGVDSVASCAALAVGGQTAVFLGCGIDVVYPGEHAGFKKIIESRGVVFSEFAPGTEPKGSNFPIRNRLISGLCQGTLIVEGPKGSGSLITAKYALSQGRDVFAVPANVGDPNAEGVNQLIHEGAHVTLSADDILNRYSMLYRHTIKSAAGASLGRRSDYDPAMLARMGVYSRTVGGFERVSAATLAPAPPPAPETAATAPPPAAAPTKQPPPLKPPKSSGSGPVKKVAAESPLAPKPCPADHSAEALASLSPREKAVFEAIPMDAPVALDRLQSLGYSTGELLASLSLLEIRGLVLTLPGGLYCRA